MSKNTKEINHLTDQAMRQILQIPNCTYKEGVANCNDNANPECTVCDHCVKFRKFLTL